MRATVWQYKPALGCCITARAVTFLAIVRGARVLAMTLFVLSGPKDLPRCGRKSDANSSGIRVVLRVGARHAWSRKKSSAVEKSMPQV